MNDRMIKYYMEVAHHTAKLSRARRLQVGCVVIKDDAIISHGWNGTPKGFDNNCENENEDGSLTTKNEVIHSEINAISKIAKSTHSSDGAIMFLTHSPCYDCSKAIIQSGIKKVYFKTLYRNSDPINLLKKANVEVHQI